MRLRLRDITLTAAVLLTSACVSLTYGPITPDQPYGYSETKRADGSYILRVIHPVSAEAMAFWDKRAEELCGSSTYAKNIYQATRPTLLYSTWGGRPGDVVLEGVLTCNATAAAPT